MYPVLVGNDIGCGIGLWQTELKTKAIKRETWADRLRDLDDDWNGNVQEFLDTREIATSGYEGSLGTIGGGNHFAELQSTESIGDQVRAPRTS